MNPPVKHNDQYFWLRDDTRSSEEVLDHLRKEVTSEENAYMILFTQSLFIYSFCTLVWQNTYASRITAHTKDFCNELFHELKSHVKETDEEG